jgi:transposase-like protein
MVLEIRTRLCQRLKKKQGHLGDTWFPDELFVKINGQQQYLWRAAKSDGNVIVQPSGSFADCCAVKARNQSE